ncbi:MAG: flavodoxin-dependent (E)-4-hydroxy-3-methylbut-2-enyl-diphosphate synthase [Candidatus Aminicenantes bacterium]|nr:flavodoxin-dependent (E)-4-hydroxy-3-methylbut-2-enyl-diphosphate synthase [Candidatus Aminicenantes bacterium]
MKREIFIGGVGVGGTHPVSIQSMTSTPTGDAKATLKQIEALKQAGCEIVRVGIPDKNCLTAFADIVKKSPLPVVADIHFHAFLALRAIEAGAQGIRINPGNMGSPGKLKEILILANQAKIPIRIGVNSGSIEKKYRQQKGTKAEIMVRSVMDKVKFFEDNGFFNMKLSLKSSNVRETVTAYRLIDKECDYPLHLGITEAGTFFSGTVKSALGIGSLLLDGIGDTIRVSLTDNPVEEIRVAEEILKVTGLRDKGIEIISCPTCSRTTVDLIAIVKEVEKKTAGIETDKKITAAIMGCEVNGPGEAREADIGVAFSKSSGYIFKKGKKVEKIAPLKAADRLIELIEEAAAPGS